MILDGAAISVMLFGQPLPPDVYLRRFYPEMEIPPSEQIAERTVPLLGRVNHGRWIASCPCGAKGVPAPGGLVWRTAPLVWCVRCENAAVGGSWRPVIIPPDQERLAVEAVLLCRPKPETRNWEPGATVDLLISENLDAGDPVPGDDDAPSGLSVRPLPGGPPPAAATAFSPLPTDAKPSSRRRRLLRSGQGRARG